ncbi:hypothetical protein [Paraburkholderia sp. MM6662-R1]
MTVVLWEQPLMESRPEGPQWVACCRSWHARVDRTTIGKVRRHLQPFA